MGHSEKRLKIITSCRNEKKKKRLRIVSSELTDEDQRVLLKEEDTKEKWKVILIIFMEVIQEIGAN